MSIFHSTKPSGSTPFSDFFRHAPSREKKKVYDEVLKRATDRQRKVIEQAASEKVAPE